MNPIANHHELTATTRCWELEAPFVITGHTFTTVELLHVVIGYDGVAGHGEAAGVYYLNETGPGMLAQIESIRPVLEQGISRDELQVLLPAGGARNAIDCALWDLEAKLQSKSIWELTGIEPRPAQTVFTIVIDTPEAMARKARQIDNNKLKVKLDGHAPLAKITAVCKARPDAEIVVDANQGWTFGQLADLAPRFRDLGITMIEQPLPRGADQALEDYASPVMLCADESCLDRSEFEQAARRYQMINIKLDKTGGLTEALDLAHTARAAGVELMVGNMVGTSLAMAPGLVIAQLCRFVDLDGPTFLTRDRPHAMSFDRGRVSHPVPELWG